MSRFKQTFVESCVDFEVAHLPILMVQRLPYLEIHHMCMQDLKELLFTFPI